MENKYSVKLRVLRGAKKQKSKIINQNVEERNRTENPALRHHGAHRHRHYLRGDFVYGGLAIVQKISGCANAHPLFSYSDIQMFSTRSR